MQPDKRLFAAIDRSKIAQARRMTPQERLIESLRHSESVIDFMRAGVRHRYPDADDNEVERRLVEQVRKSKRLLERR